MFYSECLDKKNHLKRSPKKSEEEDPAMDPAAINELVKNAIDQANAEADARAEQKLEERLKEAEDSRLTKKLDDEVLEIIQRALKNQEVQSQQQNDHAYQ